MSTNRSMNRFFFLFFLIFLITFGFNLNANNNWSHKWKNIIYERELRDQISIIEALKEDKDDSLRFWFNKGYNPGGSKYTPIPSTIGYRIKLELQRALGKLTSTLVEKLKNCPSLQKYPKISENFNKLPQDFLFTTLLTSTDEDANINLERLAIKDDFLQHFLYHFGKQLREIKNGTRNKFEFEDKHFRRGDGSSYGAFQSAIGHEMLHVVSGYDTGKHIDECIVHCLTKKCIDPNWTLKDKDYSYSRFITKKLSCNEISEDSWREVDTEGGDISSELKPGDCFCDIKWEENADCDKKTPPKKQLVRNSAPDDNYSYFSGADLSSNDVMPSQIVGDFSSFNFYPDVLVYNKFEYTEITQLLDKYKLDFISDYSHDYFDNNHKVLVIPSGEWMGEEQSEITREAIRQFVNHGGTIIVLSQQYDEHIQGLVPIPENETLTAYGWRQDQSCYNGSVYFDTIHPVLSLSTSELVTATVDGYFASWPSNANVILNRTKNNDAAILHYPQGDGHVILTSFFTDWGALHLTVINEVKC